MNERIWEGIIQVLRKDEAPLTATARLWRRDDFFGTDWGGQLEIPIALRRALPPGEYTIVLAPGREAVAFIGLGPSNAASTFPTVTGTSAPPFGAAPAPAATEADEDEISTADLALEADAEDGGSDVDDDVDTGDDADVEEAPAPKTRSIASRPASRTRSGARTAASKPTARASTQQPKPVEQPKAVTPPAEEPRAEPTEEPTMPDAAPTASGIEAVTPLPFTPPAVGWNGNSAEGIARTERLARAFLAAVDTRQRMQSVNAPGVEGHLFASARAIVDDLAGLIEARLRGVNEPAPWLGQRLAALEWFGATVASMPDRPDLVELGQSLTRLAGVVHTTVTEPQAVAA